MLYNGDLLENENDTISFDPIFLTCLQIPNMMTQLSN